MSAIVIAVTTKIVVSHGKVRFGRIGLETQGSFHRRFRHENALRLRIEIEKVEKIVCPPGVAIGENEVRVAIRRLLQSLQRL